MKTIKIAVFWGAALFCLAVVFSAPEIFAQHGEWDFPPEDGEAIDFYVPAPFEDFSEHKQISYSDWETVVLADKIQATLCPEIIHINVTVNYPKNLGHPLIDEKIRDYAHKRFNWHPEYKQSLTKADQARCDSPNMDDAGYVETLYLVTKSSSNYITVLFYYYQLCGGRPYWAYETFNFDLKTGALLTFDEIFANVKLSDSDYEIYRQKYAQEDQNFDLLFQGKFSLTPVGGVAACGPYACSKVMGLQSDTFEITKEDLIQMGVSPKYWQ